ncbi:gpi-anchored cell wall organization protein ecm33 [Zymoseptoria brevis]|uniref:Gpi-anchored cell wall organization protein ecm33 n=1 Tax=Zymoseptoria brevis TaxID=1047168 RepID=A0A0F4GJW2_9PEZI|nr:gpi-anchored cell wall organization protein ecm33 [Zymoseptoria brevis]
MSIFRYIVPALAVAAGAAAQCGNGGTATIQNSGDASALASCQTYDGSIAIATDVSGNIAIDGVRKITGDLIANNVTGLTGLSAQNLQEVEGSFELTSLTVLTSLNFPVLTKLDTISWITLPALQGLSFTTGVQELNGLEISDTELSSLDGINLEVADTIIVTNNRYLTSINMQLGNVTDSIILGANSKDLVIEFPNLIWANNMTISNCSEFTAQSLETVNGSVAFYYSTFKTLSAANLTEVGGDLTFVANNELTNISMPMLESVGSLAIANNSALEEVNGFASLATISGAVDFDGAFTAVELPKLDDVRGAFTIVSSKSINETCSTFDGLQGENNVIKGDYLCQGETETSTSDQDGTSTGNKPKKSSGAANPMLIPGATGVLGLFAAMFGLL